MKNNDEIYKLLDVLRQKVYDIDGTLKLILVFIIGSFLLQIIYGCSTTPYTTKDKAMLGVCVAGQSLDAYSTIDKLNDEEGYQEENFILGSDPSSGTVILFKAGVVGLAIALGEIWPEHRPAIFGVFGAAGLGAAVWNLNQ